MLTRRSRFSTLLLSSAVAGAAWLLQPTFAQEAPAPAPAAEPAPATPAATEAAPAAPAANATLKTEADDFLHYSIIGNDQLAKSNGQAILDANPDPRDFLAGFEASAQGRDIRGVLLRNQRNPELKDISKKLLDRLEEGYRASARDPKRIEAEIQRLADGPRAYMNARDRLVAAGQFAAPYYISTLQNEKQKNLHPYVLRVMTEIGRPLVGPLCQQLQTPNPAEKITLINILGQIRYPQALPYLKAVAADPKSAEDVKHAAQEAISAIAARGAEASPADSFYNLAQAYYYKKPSVAPLHPTEARNPVWYYDKGLNNVVAVPVQTVIWGDVECMRANENALKLEPNKGPAISLWLAANLRRELTLPAGEKDPTRAEGQPDAAYYARAAGPIYVNPVLALALQDRDTGVVLKAIQALEATGGIEGLVSSKEGGTPLVKALSYPDRGVRFAAAFALAKANPAKEFPGYVRVVPVLTEAIGQTGTPNVLLVEPDEQTRNKIKAALTSGYNVFDGPDFSAALQNARKAAAFDVVIIPSGAEVMHLQDLARTDYRLTSAPVLVTAPKDRLALAQAQIASYKGYKALDAGADDKGITEAVATLKAESAGTPIDATQANAYALTAIKILDTLAIDHASIYKVSEAQPTLIDALKDKRNEVVVAAAGVLGKLNSGEAQKAIAGTALAEGGESALRVALLNALADSAKHTANVLDPAQISQLIKIVSTEQDPAVRIAAATALGALNVQSNQAGTLILQQAK